MKFLDNNLLRNYLIKKRQKSMVEWQLKGKFFHLKQFEICKSNLSNFVNDN